MFGLCSLARLARSSGSHVCSQHQTMEINALPHFDQGSIYWHNKKSTQRNADFTPTFNEHYGFRPRYTKCEVSFSTCGETRHIHDRLYILNATVIEPYVSILLWPVTTAVKHFPAIARPQDCRVKNLY